MLEELVEETEARIEHLSDLVEQPARTEKTGIRERTEWASGSPRDRRERGSRAPPATEWSWSFERREAPFVMLPESCGFWPLAGRRPAMSSERGAF